MQQNPAALIVNTESYQRMDAHFSPDQFDLPQVVKVASFSSAHGEVVRDFVLDGMTRTKYVHDNLEAIKKAHPNFNFNVRDVTGAVLRNPRIVPFEERPEEGKQTLTMLQYLRAVVPPTAEHSAIASDRIAAHLINGWDTMVGEDLAKRFSALAAMSVLTQGTINEYMLRDMLKREKALMADETLEERVVLEQRIFEMASIIREARLIPREVARSAFMLVSGASPVIGGQREAVKQIYGMLYAPEVERKLSEAFPQVGEREGAREELGKMIDASLRRLAEEPNKQQGITAIGEALRDKTLDLGSIQKIVRAASPENVYVQVRQIANRDKLVHAYQGGSQGGLTQTEGMLLDQLGAKTILADADLPRIVASIRRANGVASQAEAFRTQLIEEKEQFVASGVSEETIKNSLTYVSNILQGLVATESPQALSRKAQEMLDALEAANSQIGQEIDLFKATGLVNEIYGDALQEGFGPQIGTGIAHFLVRETGVRDEKAARETLRQLRELPEDVQMRVVRGDIRLAPAIKIQRERARISPSPVSVPRAPQTKPQAAIPAIEEEVLLDRRASEERRKRFNNEHLQRALTSLASDLESIDLTHAELLFESEKAIDTVLRKLGKLRFDYPDLVRAFYDYKRQTERDVYAAKARVEERQEEAAKDTRTRQ
ncbi:MAG: hypothetical protein HYV40_03050 [Candidatus Levybacteria bacterium]|nr:hypothetical protein [Candidatus Levybacteria bacterium]